jgi:hypothetical protein
MKSANWDSAPAGTTHFNPLGRSVYWFSQTASGWRMYKGGAWVHCSYSEQLLRALIKRPDDSKSWDGQGQPPPGTACEFLNGGIWTGCIFEASIRGLSVFTIPAGELVTDEYAGQYKFRPVRTPEQIADEANRAATVAEMNRIVGDIEKYPTWTDALAGLYDAGLRFPVAA